MTATMHHTSEDQRAGHRRLSVAAALRGLLVVGWLVVVAVLVTTGERTATLGDLRDDLLAGEVGSIEVDGALPSSGVTGMATVQVRWRSDWVAHVAEVQQYVNRRGVESYTVGGQRVPGDLVADLAALDPDVAVRTGESRFGGVTTEVWGWSASGWVALASLVLFALTLGTLVGGPEPWRATRWAWFWLLWVVPPLGVLAFLALSGPVARAPAPRHPERRLTGWPAFFLALVVGAAVGGVAGAG